jgi:hypothetical protein
MLNEYLTNDLLREETLKRDYFLSTSQKDNSWKGGPIIVPFKATGASSVRMGKLTAINDIAQDSFVRGEIPSYKEAWGSMIFNSSDIMNHSGRVNEDSFLKILPDLVDDFAEYMKMVVSIQLGTGPHFATLTVDGTVGGVGTFDKIDRFCLDQKVTLKGTVAAAADFYVINININTNEVIFSASRGGAAADISAYTVADAGKAYTDDADVTSFQSMRDAYLSAANGGSATLHGQTKTDYPFLQSVNIDGSSWTPANILSKLFDGYTEVRKKARGRASDIICSYAVGGAIMQAIENGGGTNGYRGNYQVSVKDKKASLYGWDEIMLTTVKGDLKIVMIQEWDDDVVVYHDPKSCTFRTNGYFKDRANPDSGQKFYEVRTEDGFQYVVDKCLFGEMEHTKPGNNGIVHGLSGF